MSSNRFPIGFWQRSKNAENSPETVKEWARLGMTLALLSAYDDGDAPKPLLNVLDACEEYGIKAIVCDRRVTWHGGLVPTDPLKKKPIGDCGVTTLLNDWLAPGQMKIYRI